MSEAPSRRGFPSASGGPPVEPRDGFGRVVPLPLLSSRPRPHENPVVQDRASTLDPGLRLGSDPWASPTYGVLASARIE